MINGMATSAAMLFLLLNLVIQKSVADYKFHF
jgi:hypothetical protein